MKILWFTNTPSLVAKQFNYSFVGGGWISSLEEAVVKHDDIKLGVAFLSSVKASYFERNGVKYYPILNVSSNKMIRWIMRLFNVIQINKDIDLMLKTIEDFKPDIIHIHGTEQLSIQN